VAGEWWRVRLGTGGRLIGRVQEGMRRVVCVKFCKWVVGYLRLGCPVVSGGPAPVGTGWRGG